MCNVIDLESISSLKEHAVNYREAQRQKVESIRQSVFRDPGQGMFFEKEREFVLKDPALNLWGGIRDDAKKYFADYGISWWKGDNDSPTGHLLSSQVACLNHLYYARQRKDVATAILKRIHPEITEAMVVDKGYVEFEYIGQTQYLKERGFTRGANCTSIDAVMMGLASGGRKIMFLIEWKYTESYGGDDLYCDARSAVYDQHIVDPEGPFIAGLDPKSFYREPFYQMMRQTLLGWLFVKNRELGCDSCVNVHIIPDGNAELKTKITSPALSGEDIHVAWRHVLKNPDMYKSVDPADLLSGAAALLDTKSWLNYLEARYWK